MKDGIISLLKKGWIIPKGQENILSKLFKQKIDSYQLIPLIGKKNKFGSIYFQLFLQNREGDTSNQPVIIGLYNRGKYPGYNWVEIIRFASQIDFDTAEKVYFSDSGNRLTQQLFKYLVDLLPPGGHIMVEYDSPEHLSTARLLALGVPPVTTPLGYTLLFAGCDGGFRDWYIAEGGSEGPRKIQGNKALNKEHARKKAQEMSDELMKFLSKSSSMASSQLEKEARGHASTILKHLQ